MVGKFGSGKQLFYTTHTATQSLVFAHGEFKPTTTTSSVARSAKKALGMCDDSEYDSPASPRYTPPDGDVVEYHYNHNMWIDCHMCGAKHLGRFAEPAWCFSAAIELGDADAVLAVVAYDCHPHNPRRNTFDVSRHGRSDTSSVAAAMRARHFHVARALLTACGADPDAYYGAADERIVALQYAATAEHATMLFDAGATCDARMLGALCRSGNVDVVRVAVERTVRYLDARTCTTDRRKRTTLLHEAASVGNTGNAMVRWLIESVGVDPCALDAAGRTALDTAMQTAHHYYEPLDSAYLRAVTTVQL